MIHVTMNSLRLNSHDTIILSNLTKAMIIFFAVNADECLLTRMQEMSLDYHFIVEQEVGSSTYDFFGFNGKCSNKAKFLCILSEIRGFKKLDYMMQGRLVSGEFRHSMKPEDGKTEQQWRTWIWLSELVLKAGNSFMFVTSRYYNDLNMIKALLENYY